MKRSWLIIGGIGLMATMLFVGVASAEYRTAQLCSSDKSAWCVAPKLTPTLDLFGTATVPKLATPAWMDPPAPAQVRSVDYSVTSRGSVNADMDEFRNIVNATLNDSRGWSRLGVAFREVESGGQFTIYLSEASQMTTFSATGCDSTYSCRVGSAIIINQDRWLDATPSWTGAGGDLASYRQMVINHETGHWLGHGHRYCAATGELAPVMQQQSMDMQGCLPNAWPQTQEMYAPALGIRS